MSSSTSRRFSRRGKKKQIVTIYDARTNKNEQKDIKIKTPNLKGFLKVLHTNFSLRAHETFVLVTTDRRVVDNDIFNNLEDGATLYLVRHQHQVLPGATKEDISFVPHYDTLIQSGKSEYYANGDKSLPYALAELVDNSISATAKNKGERKIEIRVLFEKIPEKSAIIVLDNGCGMTSKQLNDWAVYRLSKFQKKERICASEKKADIRPKPVRHSINSDISYFGVGGKHAAFFIGDTIKMITKTASSPDIHELLLSKEEFEKRNRNKENIYRGTILNRKPGDTSHLKTDEQFLLGLTNEEAEKENFTAAVITGIKHEHLSYLKDELNKWTTELAHVYHYYIHGLDGNDRRCSIGSLNDPTKLNIMITLWESFPNVPIVINLRDVGNDLQSLFINATADVFEFSAFIPPDSGTVEGIIRYHPFLYDRETYPANPYSRKAAVDDDDCELEPGTQNQARGNRNVFECFWNGRLIPYTTVPDFDWCSQPLKNSPIPSECYSRFSGVLFTDDKFQVSTNKLHFLELELKLKSNETIFTPIMKTQKQPRKRNIQKEFQQWLRSCHEKYDKQIKFVGFIETITRSDQSKKMQNPWATFSSIEWGKKTYAAGQLVKTQKTKCTYYGTIVRFLLYGNYDGDVYGIGGQVEIVREPKELYDMRKIIPLHKIDQSASLEVIYQAIENDSYKIPESLIITWVEGNPWSENSVFRASTFCGPLQAEIQNKRGELLSRIQTGGHASGIKMCLQLNIVYHASSGDEVVYTYIAPFVPQSGYYFPKTDILAKVGSYTLNVNAIVQESGSNMYAGRRLPSFMLNFVIQEGNVDRFIVVDGERTVAVGQPFDIDLLFKDCTGNSATPPPQAQPVLECSDLFFCETSSVFCKGKTLHIKGVKAIGKLQEPMKSQGYNVKVILPGIRKSTFPIKLFLEPGVPSSIHVMPEKEAFQIENGNCACFNVEVHDEAGNITSTPKQLVSCQVSDLPLLTTDCSTGAGLITTKPINLTIVDGKSQNISIMFKMPNHKNVVPTEVKLEVLPSNRVSAMKLYCEGEEKLILKNNEKIKRKAGGKLDNLSFELYDESGKKIQLTDAIASKIKANWTGEMCQSDLMMGKLPDVQVSTQVKDERYYQVSYQDQSISSAFTIVPCPDEPSQLRAILPQSKQSTLKLGETLQGRIRIEFLDQFNNLCQEIPISTAKQIKVEAEGLDSSKIRFACQGDFKCIFLRNVCFHSGVPGPRELLFSYKNCVGRAVIALTAGRPSQLLLTHGPEMPLHIFTGQGISSPFVVQLCDAWGNPSPDQRVVVQMKYSPSTLKMVSSVKSQPVDHEGKASFLIESLSGESGDYKLEFVSFLGEKLIPGPSVTLTIIRDTSKPRRLSVDYNRNVRFIAGSIFPVFSVTVLSDDGSSISRFPPSDLYMSVRKVGNPTITSVTLRCSQPLKDDKKDRYYFRDKKIPKETGEYTIEFSLHVQNACILQSTPVSIIVEANKPVKLGSCHLPKSSKVVYCCTDIGKRTLMENMTLSLMDEFGNESGQNLNGRVLVSISTNNKESRQVPLFENNSDTIEMKLEAGKIFVARLAIKERSPGDNAVAYKVTFKPEVWMLSSSLESFVLPFYYFQVEKSHQSLAQLTASKKVLEEKMKETAKTITDFRDLLNLLTGKKEAYKKEDQHFVNELNKKGLRTTHVLSSEDIANILFQKEAEKRIIENSPRRVCNIQGNIQNPDSHKDILGMVGHLAFIKDDDIARVISWHLSGDLDCIITRSSETARSIYSGTAGHQQLIALDSTHLQRKRVLPHLRFSKENFHPRGHPVFAIDLLIFPYERESCELAFRNLLGETIVMDDLGSALSYRRAVVARKMPCPTILTRQGDRINAKGKFGGLQNKAPSIDKLHVFGAPLPQCYYLIESQIDTLTRYHALKVDQEKTMKEYDTQLKHFNEEGRKRSLTDTKVELDRVTKEIEFELLRNRKRPFEDFGEPSGSCIKKPRSPRERIPLKTLKKF